MKKRSIFSVALIVVMCLAIMVSLVACNNKGGDGETNDTLVVGYSRFSNKFSPFFAKTSYDQDVANMTQVSLLTADRGGAIVYNSIEGETIAYNGTDYTYKGMSDLVVTKNTDGTVYYDITIRDDVKFSDGTALTIDDVIFTMYALSDPAYNGSSTFYALPIAGMAEYRSGMDTIENLIIDMGRTYSATPYFTEAQHTAYWNAVDAAGVDFVKGILSKLINTYGANKEGDSVATYMANWGYNLEADATEADAWAAIEAAYDNIKDANASEAGDVDLFDMINKNLGDAANSYLISTATGETAANISGITRVSDTQVRVTMTEFDAVAIYQLAISIAPMHYYGSTSAYDYANNQFGFTKGDLTSVRNKTTAPVGAGAYKFVSYTNGVVTFNSNSSYYLGAPKIKNVLFQETDDADKISGISAGTFDISDPSISNSAIDAIKTANGNNEITGKKLTTDLVDFLGYGYIGINAKTVCVNNDIDSDASKNLRKAIATVFASQREVAINSYYGDRATVINYPMSNTSWAAPQPNDAGYALAYNKDVNGDAIYSADDAQSAIDAKVKAAALGLFQAAGYTVENGKVTAAPTGASMSYEVLIPGDGTGDHPSFAIMTASEALLKDIGITLTVTDLTNSQILWDRIEAGTQQIWCAAWGATVDPDMYQVYHSSNIVGGAGTESNSYFIQDDTLDQLIMDARKTDVQSVRKNYYKQCLDIIMDWGVEIPVYQRKNAIVISTERVKISTLTKDITPFYGWMAEIEKLEMN